MSQSPPPAHRPATVLFDFDGTLADSYAAITASVNHVLAARGLPPLAEAVVRGKVGFGLHQLMHDLLPGSDAEENARLYRAHHPTVMISHTRLLPGARELLAALHAESIPMGICSNKPSAITKQLTAALDLDRYFGTVLGPEDVARPKPAPDMLLVGLRQLGGTAERALFVGDMTIDIETAKSAGVAVWVMPTGSHDEATLKAAGPEGFFADLHAIRQSLFSA
jgi:2-phosphoglycolate phosphatase